MKNFFIILVLFCSIFYTRGLFAQTLYTLDGEKIQLKDIISSEKVVLFFWTTTCPYCVIELNRLNKKFPFSKYNDIKFFYINIEEEKATVEKYAKSAKLIDEIRKKILLDTFGIVTEKYYIQGIPTYIFLKKGSLVHRSFYLNERVLEKVF